MKTQSRIILSIVCLGLALVAGFFLSPSGTGRASSPASLSLGVTLVPEGDDFATRVLGLPWNMSGVPYPDFYTALKNIDRPGFKITADGTWELESTNTDPTVWLLFPGIDNTQPVLRLGDSRPIDASRYTLLSYYMCLNDAPSPANGQDEDWAAKVYWFYDTAPEQDPANGSTNFVFFKQQDLFENDGDCALMTIDLSQPSAWANGSWNNNPRMVMGLRLDPINKGGKSFEIDWARLTTVDTSNTIPLSWTDAPTGDIEFYLSQKACGVDGILVGVAANPNGSGTFNWGAQLQPGYSAAHPLPIPESFEPGVYQVYLKDANGGIACSPSPLTIHGAPILDFQSPSAYSGKDYATTVVKDAWGMSNASDIKSTSHVGNLNYNNGILTGVTTGDDPRLTLNVDGPIDTSTYRYVTFRMKVDGEKYFGDGWVQRFIWWYAGPTIDSRTTDDMVIYEGWHTYAFDLKTAYMEPCGSATCWSGSPTSLRFDPVEAPPNTTFHLDFLTLTSLESVSAGEGLKVHFTLPNAPEAAVTMYLDTDRNPMNGRIFAPQMPSDTSPVEFPTGDPFQIFMPLLFRPGSSAAIEFNFFANSEIFEIDTNGMTSNTYYISADVSDGVMTTTWYSDMPVVIE